MQVIKWQYDDVIMASTSVKNEAQKKSRWDMTNSDNKGSTSAASGFDYYLLVGRLLCVTGV